MTTRICSDPKINIPNAGTLNTIIINSTLNPNAPETEPMIAQKYHVNQCSVVIIRPHASTVVRRGGARRIAKLVKCGVDPVIDNPFAV